MSIGASLLSAGVGLLTSNNNKKAAQTAANSDKAIADERLAQQQGQFNDLKTTAAAGAAPYEAMGNTADVNGANYHTSPGFESAVAKGTQNVLGSNALNGLLRSGSAVKALSNYTVGAANQDYNNYIAQQQGNAHIGEAALGSQLGSLGEAASGNANALAGNIGANTAANGITAGASIDANNGIASALGQAGTPQNLNALLAAYKNSQASAGGGTSYGPQIG